MTSSHFKLLATVLIAGGCSQILGISDYEIVDDPNGEGGDTGQGGDSAGSGKGGKSTAGDAGAAQAGEGPGPGGSDQGGMPGQAGSGTTVGGAGGEGGNDAPPEVVIPCDSVECCETAGGVVSSHELLDNLGFENEDEKWWGEESELGYDLIVEEDADSINAHGGAWYAWLGGDAEEIAVMLTPELDVPPQTGWVTVSGWRRFAFDTMLLDTDWSSVSVYKENDYSAPYKDLFLWDNFLDETSGWEFFTATEPGADYLVPSVQLSLIAVTDEAVNADDPEFYASNFYYDDLSFLAEYCVEP